MKRKVLRKQTIANHCFICGRHNEAGMKMSFYEIEGDEVVGIFCGKKIHASYPDRMHGGIIGAVIDETMGRAIEIKYPSMLGVTVDLRIKYRKPVPLGVELKCIGRVDTDTSRMFECSGEILGTNGELLVTASGTYFKMSEEKLAQNPLFTADTMSEDTCSPNLEYIEIDRA